MNFIYRRNFFYQFVISVFLLMFCIAPVAEAAAVNVLTNAVSSAAVTAAKGYQVYYSIAVPNGASSLTITTTGGSGDDDFYVKLGVQPVSTGSTCSWRTKDYTWKGATAATNESVTITNPASGTYYITLVACSAISKIQTKATYTILSPLPPPPAPAPSPTPTPTPAPTSTPALAPTLNTLANGVSSGLMTSVVGKYYYFAIPVPAGATNLTIDTLGGSGDDDFYVKLGSQPVSTGNTCSWNVSDYTWKGATAAVNESTTIISPVAGTYYITVATCSAISNISITATYTVSAPAPTPPPPAPLPPPPAPAPSPTPVPTSTPALAPTLNTLTNAISSGLMTSTVGKYYYFAIPVPAGATNLTINTLGGSGDDDFYVKLGTQPISTGNVCSWNASDYTWKGATAAVNESATIISPVAGTYYVTVAACSALSNISITATYTVSAPAPTPPPPAPLPPPPAPSPTPTPTPAPSTKFTLNDRISVSSGPLNVRATPSTSGTILGTQPTGALGTVIGGPVAADGYNWWSVTFDTGVSGWVAEDFLVKSVIPAPTPSTKFLLNDRVSVSSGPLNVRAIPSTSGTILGTQPTGALGTVVGGPVAANGYNWWNIAFDAGMSGWVAEDFLSVVIPAPTPTPTPDPLPPPPPPLSCAQSTITPAIATQAAWDAKYDAAIGNAIPGPLNGGNDFAWHGHYWLRADISMAKTYGDTKYMDRAVSMIDYWFAHSDTPQGWKGTNNDPANGMLNTGVIAHAVSLFAYEVWSDARFAAYRPKADAYLATLEPMLHTYDAQWVDGAPYSGAPSFWVYATCGGICGSNSLLMYNQGATMANALLLIDRVYRLKGLTPDPVYQYKADKAAAYFKTFARLNGSAYLWNYAGAVPQSGDDTEDTNHGHLDVSLLKWAYKFNLGGITNTDMTYLTGTLQTILTGQGADVSVKINGTGNAGTNNWDRVSGGYDWIDLVDYNPVLFDKVINVYNTYMSNPEGSRFYLGWAEILRKKNCVTL